MTRLLCIPYENREDLLVAVIRFRGTYFMCEIDTEKKKQEEKERTPKQEEMCAWGFKFEQYVTASELIMFMMLYDSWCIDYVYHAM